MKPQELRIGNTIMCQCRGEYKPHTIKSIWYNDEEKLYFVELDNGFQCNINGITPIPITDELLLKCGFKKDVEANSLYRYAIDNCLFEIRLWGIGTLIKLENYCEDCVRKVHLPKTPNLHQLQNAYYLVTGKELEIEF